MSRALDVQWASHRRTTRADAEPNHNPRPSNDEPRQTQAHRARRIVLFVSAIVGTGVLVLGFITDLHVRSELRQACSSLQVTRVHLALSVGRLSLVESTLGRTTSRRDALQVELTATSQELGELWTFVYLAPRHLLELVLVHLRSDDTNQVERPNGIRTRVSTLRECPGMSSAFDHVVFSLVTKFEASS